MELLKIGDFVQLQAGHAPKMQISSIDEVSKTAMCVWYDPQKRKHNTDALPLNVLKLFPEKVKISLDEIKESIYRR
jgi:uncharacterized protein YodC (DUF2158 family)